MADAAPDPLLAELVAAAKLQCIGALTTPEALKEPLTALVQALFDAHAAGEMDVAADALGLLFDIGCSGSGTVVQTTGDTVAGVGVLLCGFAGSSLRVLGAYVAFYRKAFPDWKVVATVASGLALDPSPEAKAAYERQADQVVAGLAGCQRILVHCMSNNGQGLFASLMQRKGSVLRARVAAVLYDCACARAHQMRNGPGIDAATAAATSAHVVTSTIFMPLLEFGVTVTDPKSKEQISARPPPCSP